MAIDRRSVVARHDVVLTAPDATLPLTVGNGDFACTVDITGMQTFTEFHDPRAAFLRPATNTCTQTTWGWHEMPNPAGYTMAEATTEYDTPRGPVPYPDKFDMMAALGVGTVAPEMAAGNWLAENPHRLDLGRVGLVLRAHPDAAPETDPAVLSAVHQHLQLWAGTIHSRFTYAGKEVEVTTAAHPDRAEVAFRIRSRLLTSGQLGVALRYPYASEHFMFTTDWNAPERHTTAVESRPDGARITRTLDATTYGLTVAWNAAELVAIAEPHVVEVRATGDVLELVVAYDDGTTGAVSASAEATFAAAAAWWESFWSSGAALDFAGSTDPRAHELERRVVLSQYLTAVHCSGVMPPQETGLLANSWNGKFHLEMHWWHAAHFVPWGRSHLLERSLDWYQRTLPVARAVAESQHFPGARWPKQVGPDGRESPGDTAPFLVWQQPHPLYFAELLYRADPTAEIVARYAEIVDATATFMAAFAFERDGEYHLLPPLIPAQESYDRFTATDPTFELAYWWWGLEIAQRWRERLGEPRHQQWADVQARLAAPHTADGCYTAISVEPYLVRQDHPSLLAGLGVVPATPLIDPAIMRATLHDVLREWEWDSAWGWDFPVMAMTATRVGDPAAALDSLLYDAPKNSYAANGHTPQRGNRLPLYLPSNGGLLAAVSLMIAGWDGASHSTPGFPADGSWTIAHEGFHPWP
jgi:hypothetical protein